MMLFEENIAIGLTVWALMATHPNPSELGEVLTKIKAQAAEAMKQTPPSNLQLLRHEQLLEQFLVEIRA